VSLEDRFSATRLAGVALAASLWLFVSVSLTLLPWPDALFAHHRINWLWMSLDIAWLLLGIAAAVLMYRALGAFRRGVDAKLWDTCTLERLRTRLEHPVFNAAAWVSAVGAVGYLIVSLAIFHPGGHHHGTGMGGLVYFWLSPITVLGSLRSALKPARTPSQSTWRDDIKPITSQHWGDRGPATP
jgi:hypothetical protein